MCDSPTPQPLPIKEIRAGLKNITVIFIVLEVSPATHTKENREVRTFKVADQTACINVSVWDEPGRLLVAGDIVRMTKGYANIWRQSLTLYPGKNGDIHKIGEFTMNFNEQINMSEPNPALTNEMNQRNVLLNNGTVNNNNGNGNQSRPAMQQNVASGPPGAATLPLQAMPSATVTPQKGTPPSGGRGGGMAGASSSNEQAKHTPSKGGAARSGNRSNQTRSNMKNDRR